MSKPDLKKQRYKSVTVTLNQSHSAQGKNSEKKKTILIVLNTKDSTFSH